MPMDTPGQRNSGNRGPLGVEYRGPDFLYPALDNNKSKSNVTVVIGMENSNKIKKATTSGYES